MTRWLTKPATTMYEIADHADTSSALTNLNNPRYGRSMSKPGAYLERLPPETRAILRDLRSDDIADVRVRPWWS